MDFVLNFAPPPKAVPPNDAMTRLQLLPVTKYNQYTVTNVFISLAKSLSKFKMEENFPLEVIIICLMFWFIGI